MFLTLQLLGKKSTPKRRAGGISQVPCELKGQLVICGEGEALGEPRHEENFWAWSRRRSFIGWVGDFWMEDFWMEVVVWKMVSFIFQMMDFQPKIFKSISFRLSLLDLLWKNPASLHGLLAGENISFFLKGKEIQELTIPRWLRVGNLHSMTFCIQFADWLITTLLNAWSFVNFRGLNVFWRCSFVGHITKYWLPNYKFVCVWTFECFSLFLEFLFFWMKIQTNKHHCFALVSTFPGFKKEPYILLMATRNPKANHLGFNYLNPPVGAF